MKPTELEETLGYCIKCLRVGDAEISIEIENRTSEGRTRYRYYIDTPSFEYTGNDLKSGCNGGTECEGLASLLSFLGACGESYAYQMREINPDSNAAMFPLHVAEWCYQNSDELSLLALEIERKRKGELP